MSEEVNEIKLKVARASPEDAGQAIIRIDARAASSIGVGLTDIVEIEGTRVTAAAVERTYPADVGRGIISMDGLIRKNAGTSIGETVKVRKVIPKEAKKVVIALAQAIPQHIPLAFRISKGWPLRKGDIISPIPRRHEANPFQLAGSFAGAPAFGSVTDIKFIVASTDPAGTVLLTEDTEIELKREVVEVKDERLSDVTYEDIGGLRDAISKVREMIELPLKHPELFERLGVEPPKGVLLFGPPGTGKTLLAKAVANESSAYFKVINGPEIVSKWYGESEKKLREIFEEAQKNAPAIVFIDELDAIAPKREEVTGEVERRMVAQLLSVMDGLQARGQVVVIGATNREDSIDAALRRPGRFDREIEIGVPDRKGRKEILMIHTRRMPLDKDVKLDKIADVTYGYVGADLEALTKEAAMATLRRALPSLRLDDEKESIPPEVIEKLIVTKKDFENAMMVVEPSGMREVLVEVPQVKWEDVGNLKMAKQELQEAVEWPLKKPQGFKRLGIKPPKGVLLFGPPGTGKTMLAKAVANESDANFISIKGPELISKWVGESEKRIRGIFKRAKQVAPTVVFFDELDSIARRRGTGTGTKVYESVVDQLLTELDGLEDLEGVVVIGATNRPDIIDPALLRPGRFDRHILVEVPDKEGREKIFKIHTKDMPLAKGIKLAKLAEMTDGYVGADIEALCREAAIRALRKDMKAKEVNLKHFEEAMTGLRPTMTKETVAAYKDILKEFKKSSPRKYDEKEEIRYLG